MHPVVRKLSLFTSLNSAEQAAIEAAMGHPLELPAQATIAHEEDQPLAVFFLLEGFACRHKLLPNGRRQIVSILLPGDSCDIGITLLGRRDHSLATFSPSRVARVSDADLDQLGVQSTAIRDALRWTGLVEEAIAREWVLNIGARSASCRFAHALCELYYRLDAIGLVKDGGYDLPMRQHDIADMLGISAVHANRVLQELRRQMLITFDGKRVSVLDLAGLEALADFDPTYLHLTDRRLDSHAPSHHPIPDVRTQRTGAAGGHAQGK